MMQNPFEVRRFIDNTRTVLAKEGMLRFIDMGLTEVVPGGGKEWFAHDFQPQTLLSDFLPLRNKKGDVSLYQGTTLNSLVFMCRYGVRTTPQKGYVLHADPNRATAYAMKRSQLNGDIPVVLRLTVPSKASKSFREGKDFRCFRSGHVFVTNADLVQKMVLGEIRIIDSAPEERGTIETMIRTAQQAKGRRKTRKNISIQSNGVVSGHTEAT